MLLRYVNKVNHAMEVASLTCLEWARLQHIVGRQWHPGCKAFFLDVTMLHGCRATQMPAREKANRDAAVMDTSWSRMHENRVLYPTNAGQVVAVG